MNAVVSFEELYLRKISHIQVLGAGTVTSILNDDLVGKRHQRFVLELASHKTVMVVNNIDVQPRLEPLDVGDTIEFLGEYVWNRHGGLIHWTHHDPRGVREDGYVRVVADEQGERAAGEDASPPDADAFSASHGSTAQGAFSASGGQTAQGASAAQTSPPEAAWPATLGVYRHFRGRVFEALGFALHSETREDMVICRALTGDRNIWVCPPAMWENAAP